MSDLERIIKKYKIVEEIIEFDLNGETYRFKIVDLFYNPTTETLHLVYERRKVMN